MKWQGRRGSGNIEDRRGLKAAGGGLGLGAIVLFLASLFFPDAVPLLRMAGLGQPGAPSQQQVAPGQVDPNDPAAQYISVALADTEEVWSQIFREELGRDYPEPTLVLFSGSTTSPCGAAEAASGPFYCPADQKVYLDLDFFRTLERQLGAGGDFARAYVVAHEVAHHVQRQTGAVGRVDEVRRRSGPNSQATNQATVRLELQADCYAGVWANRAHEKFGILTSEDLREALNAAAKIGDDALQGRSGRVRPETFTHGTSEQRQNWLMTGLRTGDIRQCDTFSPAYADL